jgi:Xaa-Pro aminopeptidase
VIGPEPRAAAAARAAVVEARLDVVRRAIVASGGGAALLQRRRDVAWVTAGAELHVVQGGDAVAAPLLVTASKAVVIAPNNEAARITEEELGDLPIRLEVTPWYEPDAAKRVVGRLAGRDGLADAAVVEDALQAARQQLDPLEHERLRWLGQVARVALDAAASAIEPGWTEAAVVAALTAPLVGAGVRLPVVLAGADERMRYRHPLPGRAAVRDRLMLVLVAERWGLHVAATRMTWLAGGGRTHPADEQASRVLAAMRAATRPGATLGDVFEAAATAYVDEGLGREWTNHHQGGTIGYAPRERIATPGDGTVLEPGMAVAWNPSVPGGKAEATLLVTGGGPETILD